MYIQDNGLQYTKESVSQKILNLPKFKAMTKKTDPRYIPQIAERIAADIVMVADCIRIQGATKTTRLFLTVAKETRTSTSFHLYSVYPGYGVNRVNIHPDLLDLYGAKKVKQGNGHDLCFYSSVFGMSHALAATDKFFRLVKDLTGVYCQVTEIL